MGLSKEPDHFTSRCFRPRPLASLTRVRVELDSEPWPWLRRHDRQLFSILRVRYMRPNVFGALFDSMHRLQSGRGVGSN